MTALIHRARDIGRRLVRRIGYRGGSLLMFAFIDLAFAFSYLYPAPAHRRSQGILFLESIAPLWVWGILWGAAGIACLINAFRVHDRVGFAAAMSIKVLWGTLYLLAGIFVGVDRAPLSSALWFGLAGFLALLSSWPEPTRVPRTIRPPTRSEE